MKTESWVLSTAKAVSSERSGKAETGEGCDLGKSPNLPGTMGRARLLSPSGGWGDGNEVTRQGALGATGHWKCPTLL